MVDVMVGRCMTLFNNNYFSGGWILSTFFAPYNRIGLLCGEFECIDGYASSPFY